MRIIALSVVVPLGLEPSAENVVAVVTLDLAFVVVSPSVVGALVPSHSSHTWWPVTPRSCWTSSPFRLVMLCRWYWSRWADLRWPSKTVAVHDFGMFRSDADLETVVVVDVGALDSVVVDTRAE